MALYRIGCQTPFPPFSFEHQGKVVGPLVERVKSLVEKLGHKVDLVPLALPDCEPALLGQSVDMLAFLGVTEERKQRVDFGDVLIRTGAALFAPHAQLKVTDMAGRRVATPGNGPLVATLKELCPKAHVIATADYPASFRAVRDGHADAAALNKDAGAEIATLMFRGLGITMGQPFAEIDLAPAFAKGRHNEFRQELNRVIA